MTDRFEDLLNSANKGMEYSFIAKHEDFITKERVDNFISTKLNNIISRSKIQEAIVNGCLSINNQIIKKKNYALRAGDHIIFNYTPKSESPVMPENLPINVIYEDDYLLVINKNTNINTHPAPDNSGGSLVNALMFRGGLEIDSFDCSKGIYRPGVVHRLDKDTSGAIIFAKNPDIQSRLSAQFKNRTVKKKYLAVALGIIKEDTGTIAYPLGRDKINRKIMSVRPDGRPSITDFRIIGRKLNFTFLELDLKTGRTHQIRAHLKAINHPVAGDRMYSANPEKFSRLMLHSYSIEFMHPVQTKPLLIIAPLKQEFADFLINSGFELSGLLIEKKN